MRHSAREILEILDRCCDAYEFAMLDNGYVYPAATRLALYRSGEDWALTLEVFGFSPRAALPDICIYTYGSDLVGRKSPHDYASEVAYKNYLARQPNHEVRFVHPLEEGEWQDAEYGELVASHPAPVKLRGQTIPVPAAEAFGAQGIQLQDPNSIRVFELCRHLAATHRELVLTTPAERCVNVKPELKLILQLEEWCHPDVVEADKRPSGLETFQQLAAVLETGDVSLYRPTFAPNTHWRNWPCGGTL